MPFDTRALDNDPRVYQSEQVISTQFSLAELDGQLYCGMITMEHDTELSICVSENGLDFTSVRPTAPGFSVKQGVSLVYFNGYLCAGYLTPNDELGFIYSTNGMSWNQGGFARSGYRVNTVPVLLSYENKLWCVSGDNGKINMISTANVASAWSTAAVRLLGYSAIGSPIAAAIFNGKLYFSYSNTASNLEFGVYDFLDETNTVTMSTLHHIDSHQTLIVIEDYLYCFFCISGHIAYTRTKDGHWQKPVITKHEALSPPAAVIYHHGLSLVFKSPQNSQWSVVCASHVLLHIPNAILDITPNSNEYFLTKTTNQTMEDVVYTGMGMAAATSFCYYLGEEKDFLGTPITDRSALFYSGGTVTRTCEFEGAHSYIKYPNFIIDHIASTSLNSSLILPGGTLTCQSVINILDSDFTLSLMVTARSPGFLFRSTNLSLQLTSEGILYFLMRVAENNVIAVSSKPTRILQERHCDTITCTRKRTSDSLRIFVNGANVTDPQPVIMFADEATLFTRCITIGDGQLQADFMNIGFWLCELLEDELFHASISILGHSNQHLEFYWPLNGSFADVSGNNHHLVPNCNSSNQCYFDRCVDCYFFRASDTLCFTLLGPFPSGKHNINRTFDIPSSCIRLVVSLVDDHDHKQFPAQSYLKVTGPNNLEFNTDITSENTFVQMEGNSLFRLEMDNPPSGEWKVFLQSTGPKFIFSFFAVCSVNDLEKVDDLMSVSHPYRRAKFQLQAMKSGITAQKLRTLAQTTPQPVSLSIAVFYVKFANSPHPANGWFDPSDTLDNLTGFEPFSFKRFTNYNGSASNWNGPIHHRLLIYPKIIDLPVDDIDCMYIAEPNTVALGSEVFSKYFKLDTAKLYEVPITSSVFVLASSILPAPAFRERAYALPSDDYRLTVQTIKKLEYSLGRQAIISLDFWNSWTKSNKLRCLTHEALHLYGLPDMYTYDEQLKVTNYSDVGIHDIMADGWNANHQSMLGYSRLLLNWFDPKFLEKVYPPTKTLKTKVVWFNENQNNEPVLLQIFLPRPALVPVDYARGKIFICVEAFYKGLLIYGVNQCVTGISPEVGLNGSIPTGHVHVYPAPRQVWRVGTTFTDPSNLVKITNTKELDNGWELHVEYTWGTKKVHP